MRAEARNFPQMALCSFTGKVPRSSMVFVECSSDHCRMLTAGTRIISRSGWKRKNEPCRLASPMFQNPPMVKARRVERKPKMMTMA